MGVLDFLFQGSPPPQVNTYATSDTQPPQWLQAYNKGLIEKSSSIAAEPYQAYTGPRVAGFTPDQNAAFTATQNNVGSYQPQFNQAASDIGAASTPFDQNTFNQFMSPYTTGVVDRIAELGNRNLTENVLPNISDTFIRAGSYGGSRNTDFVNRAVRDNQDAILGAQSNALQTAEQLAMTNYGTAMDRTLNAGNAASALGQAQQRAGLTDAASLEAVGSEQQQLNQQNLNTAYNDFVEQRDYPKQQAEFMSEIVRGLQPGTTTSTTSTGPATSYQASPLAQLAGSVTGASALQNLLKASGGRVKFDQGGMATTRGIPQAVLNLMRPQQPPAQSAMRPQFAPRHVRTPTTATPRLTLHDILQSMQGRPQMAKGGATRIPHLVAMVPTAGHPTLAGLARKRAFTRQISLPFAENSPLAAIARHD